MKQFFSFALNHHEDLFRCQSAAVGELTNVGRCNFEQGMAQCGSAGYASGHNDAISRRTPTSLLPDERILARSRLYRNAGCFLGGSTTALALGVRARQQRIGSQSQTKIHSYDLFEAEEWTIGKLLPSDFSPKQSFRPLFDENIRDVADLVEVHAGDITSVPWNGKPIEILFVDCAKGWIVCDFITYHFFKSLIPGHSIVIQQDYIWDCWNAWIHITMEYYADYFRLLAHTSVNSVVFLYKRQIPSLQPHLIGSMDAETKVRLMRRARERFHSPQREYLERSHRQYITGPAWTNGVDAEGHRRVAGSYGSD